MHDVCVPAHGEGDQVEVGNVVWCAVLMQRVEELHGHVDKGERRDVGEEVASKGIGVILGLAFPQSTPLLRMKAEERVSVQSEGAQPKRRGCEDAMWVF